jgi:GTPase SAR1 family protein
VESREEDTRLKKSHIGILGWKFRKWSSEKVGDYPSSSRFFVCSLHPTVFDNYPTSALVDDQQINLQLWNTAGQEDYKKICLMSYPQTDIVIICFSFVSPKSLENIETIWIP